MFGYMNEDDRIERNAAIDTEMQEMTRATTPGICDRPWSREKGLSKWATQGWKGAPLSRALAVKHLTDYGL